MPRTPVGRAHEHGLIHNDFKNAKYSPLSVHFGHCKGPGVTSAAEVKLRSEPAPTAFQRGSFRGDGSGSTDQNRVLLELSEML